MPYNLVDHAKIQEDALRRGVITALLEDSVVMRQAPIETIGRLSTQVVRWRSLPTVGFRRLNEGFAESTGTFEQLDESVYPLGGDIDVERLFTVANNNIEAPRAVQTRMKLRSIAYAFNDYFVNGDVGVDPKGFDGLKKRISNLPSAQTIVAATNGLDVDDPTNNYANAHTWLDKIDEAIYALDGHVCDAIYMNRQALLKLRSVLRRAGLLDTTRDMFGRMVDTYAGIPLYDIGVKADQTTQIIGNSEVQGSASNCTSMYFCRYGVEEYLHLIEMHEIDVRDLGELESKPVFRTRIEWPVGLALWNDRSVARLQGLIVV